MFLALQLYPDGFEQAGFDTRTFNDLLVVVGNTTWEVMNARKKLIVQLGTDQRLPKKPLQVFVVKQKSLFLPDLKVQVPN